MHLKSIRTNLKTTVDYETHEPDGQYLFIHGPNASGKSALVHSIEYALTGVVTDAAGRDIKQQQYLDALANGPTAQVEVIVSTDGALSTHDGKNPRYEHVMHDALKAISGSGNALTDYLLEHGESYDDKVTGVSLDYPAWSEWEERYGTRSALKGIKTAAGKTLRAHRTEIRELKVALKYLDNSVLRSALASAEKDEETAKKLLTRVTVAIQEWVEAIAPAVVGMAYPLIPLRFHFLPKEVRLGLQSGGAVPSGAEMVEAAIGLAYATRAPGTAVYILPDRAYDPDRLAGLLRILRYVPCAAAVVQSPILPNTDTYNYVDFWSHYDID
jgi:energy-coupling factor transporter ATP-binding protein EcfA2